MFFRHIDMTQVVGILHKTKTYSFRIINIMASDVLATQGLNRDNWVSARLDGCIALRFDRRSRPLKLNAHIWCWNKSLVCQNNRLMTRSTQNDFTLDVFLWKHHYPRQTFYVMVRRNPSCQFEEYAHKHTGILYWVKSLNELCNVNTDGTDSPK